MSVAFWSEVVTTKKPFETQPPEGYVMNLQNVAVCNAKESVNLFACSDAISGDKIKALLAVLSSKIPQTQLSLVFGYDIPVAFCVEGCSKAEVHISGYYQPIGDSDDDDSDDEGDDFDEEAYLNTMRNADGSLNDEGKMLIEDDMSGSEDSQESDSEDERVDADFIKKMLAKNGGGAAEESESDPEDDSEDESEEEAPPKKQQKQQVVTTPSGGKKSKQNTPASKGKAPNSSQKNNQKSGEKRKR